MRVSQEVRALTICSRFTSQFLCGAQITIPAREWHDTRLILPEFLRGAYVNEFTGEEISIDDEVDVARLLSRAPICLLLGFL
jgi:maltooligosyltrehalose synthase